MKLRFPRIKISATTYGVIGAACGVLANNPAAWKEALAVIIAAIVPGARVERSTPDAG